MTREYAQRCQCGSNRCSQDIHIALEDVKTPAMVSVTLAGAIPKGEFPTVWMSRQSAIEFGLALIKEANYLL